jgi:hypothetical protein
MASIALLIYGNRGSTAELVVVATVKSLAVNILVATILPADFDGAILSSIS